MALFWVMGEGERLKKKKSLKTDQDDTNFYLQLALPSGWGAIALECLLGDTIHMK